MHYTTQQPDWQSHVAQKRRVKIVNNKCQANIDKVIVKDIAKNIFSTAKKNKGI
jgi:hypothetical protein